MRRGTLGLVAIGLVSACGVPADPHVTPQPTATASATVVPTASATATASTTADVAPPVPETPSKWARCESPPKGMACVPGGKAVIGSSAAHESPQHTVEISTFYVDKTEVTNAAYEACEKAGACAKRPAADASLAGAEQPAVPLTWSMAHAYCVWAGKRMLTEAEWEKVARGGEEALEYPWGKDPATCDRAQIQGCTPAATKNVGSLPAGPYGVLDMAGNGPEWVQDWGSECYGGCDKACGEACLGTDPQGVCSGASSCKAASERVLRGGAWYWAGDQGRGAARRSQKPESGSNKATVRCASSTPSLATIPPIALDARPKPADLAAPTADQLRVFRDITQDTDVEKIPLCKRMGEASQTCRDPNSYVVTNEPEQNLFSPYVKNLGGGYVGLGADQSYSFIGAAKSEWAWLFDYDPTVVRLHYILRAIILASPTKKDFLAAFEQRAQKSTLEILKKSFTSDAGFPGGKPLSDAEAQTAESVFTTARGALFDSYNIAIKRAKGDWYWLVNDESYAHVRALYQQGRIVAVKGNLLTSVAIPSIAASAKKLGVPVRIYYTSNADDQWPLNQAYRDNLVSLPFDEKSVMVHTVLPMGRKKVHDWDYVVHDGLDMQRRIRHPGWERIAWLNDEGRHIASNLITIALPAKTAREEPAK